MQGKLSLGVLAQESLQEQPEAGLEMMDSWTYSQSSQASQSDLITPQFETLPSSECQKLSDPRECRR